MAKITRSEVNRNYHGPVDLGTGNSADYVVAHADRQKSRGKKPSVSYRGISNPRLALQIAESDLIFREFWDVKQAQYAGHVVVMPTTAITEESLAEDPVTSATFEYALGLAVAGKDAVGVRFIPKDADRETSRLPQPEHRVDKGFLVETVMPFASGHGETPLQPTIARETERPDVHILPHSMFTGRHIRFGDHYDPSDPSAFPPTC